MWTWRSPSRTVDPALALACAGLALHALAVGASQPTLAASPTPEAAAAATLPPPPARLTGSAERRDSTTHPGTRSRPADELLLEVDVNQQGLRDTVLVFRTQNGDFLLGEDDLRRWRMRLPQPPALEASGMRYFALSAIPNARAQFDPLTQKLTLAIPPEAFEAAVHAMPARAKIPPPVLPQLGGFLNYNVSSTRSSTSTVGSGLFELGVFDRRGVVTSTFLAPQLESTGRLVRLETTYTDDYPAEMASLRLGDSTTAASSWSIPVRFAGAQYRTNFATQPGFIRSPIATTVSGLATLPSVVDVFVNNALVTRQSVPPGPFSITNIPTVSGLGEARLVVRDILGREEIITQSFYRNLTLLKKGLEDFSYEAGVARRDFGIAGNHYAEPLASFVYRRGVTDAITGEMAGGVTRDIADFGVSASALMGSLGLVNATAALGASQHGTGALGGVLYERQDRPASVTVQSQWTTADFRQVGYTEAQVPRRQQITATVGYQMNQWGTLSTTYIGQRNRDQPDSQVLSVGYSVSVGRRAQLNVTAFRTMGETGSKSVFTTLAIPLTPTTSATVTRERTRDARAAPSTVDTVMVQKSLPIGEGYGYRLQRRGEDSYGSVSVQTGYGTYQLEATMPAAGDTATRVSAAGGLGFVGGKTFLSRAITDSFGVVRVADYANVTVLQDNQPIARTDGKGYAAIPRLRPYDRNVVSINQNEVPLDAIILSPALVAVPYFRSGVLLDFPVKRVRSAVMRVVDGDGHDVPSGALASVTGSGEAFPVALRGELYVNGLERQNRITIRWKESSCDIHVSYPDTADPLPDLGTYVCKGLVY